MVSRRRNKSSTARPSGSVVSRKARRELMPGVPATDPGGFSFEVNMGNSTEIAWTDSTFNPWWGCSKVSPGCANCYAEAFDKRTGGDHWGAGKIPRTMSASNWNNPLKWQREAEKTGTRRKVFCGSMCDWAAIEGPDTERVRLWETIRRTPMLDWQLLTKRADRIAELLPSDWVS